ncbi:AraC-type DNA-binding domain-containing protein [Marinomonas sp. MED121]|uniref:AraC family transcriptional regulator n=1 Tax=Marinomonas sp. MED121 TaxID=314277 RepID=UPI0000690D43|nr:helix-turn-helix domain-containing protein [Marinomonas sp. MED121]EAQ65348.1 AraC-type DNA-binding domain-containing protein [Marinomonas sp. MED121]
MSHITDVWSAHSHSNGSILILPDGCRDLIIKTHQVNNRTHPSLWFVSPLFEHTQAVQTQANTHTLGFRLKPGVKIEQEKLVKYMPLFKLDNEAISHDEKAISQDQKAISQLEDMLNEVTSIKPCVEEALTSLASDLFNVTQAAKQLGMSTRSLQRMLIRETDKSPSYWLQLARARKAAKHLGQTKTMADTAVLYGYSDQSHMCREFQHWFKLSPTQLLNNPMLMAQLDSTGYGFDLF